MSGEIKQEITPSFREARAPFPPSPAAARLVNFYFAPFVAHDRQPCNTGARWGAAYPPLSRRSAGIVAGTNRGNATGDNTVGEGEAAFAAIPRHRAEVPRDTEAINSGLKSIRRLAVIIICLPALTSRATVPCSVPLFLCHIYHGLDLKYQSANIRLTPPTLDPSSRSVPRGPRCASSAAQLPVGRRAGELCNVTCGTRGEGVTTSQGSSTWLVELSPGR